MPRRIKTIHHHHHHVVLMDPDKTIMYLTKPHSFASKLPVSASAEGFLLQETRAHDLRSHKHHGRHHHQQDNPPQQQQQQHYHHQQKPERQQQGADGSDSRPPPSYAEQQKMSNHRPRNRGLTDIDNGPSPPMFFSGSMPTSRDTGWRPIASPVRDKRSKQPRLYARIVTTYD